jgi:hypothetical protein
MEIKEMAIRIITSRYVFLKPVVNSKGLPEKGEGITRDGRATPFKKAKPALNRIRRTAIIQLPITSR